MKDILDQVRRRLTGRVDPPAADPFRTYELQARLTRLAREMEALDRDRVPRFALGHHARAATRAYDQTLVEACVLAGVPVPPVKDACDRLQAEASLAQAGWSG